MGKTNDNRPKEPERDRNFIVKELGFNADQLEQFNKNNKGHHESTMRLSETIKGLKDTLFSTLSNDEINESTIDSISALICEKEAKKEKEIFYHFKMIRDIANEKQKLKFDKILMDALRQGDRENRPPPPNGGEAHRPPPQHN